MPQIETIIFHVPVLSQNKTRIKGTPAAGGELGIISGGALCVNIFVCRLRQSLFQAVRKTLIFGASGCKNRFSFFWEAVWIFPKS